MDKLSLTGKKAVITAAFLAAVFFAQGYGALSGQSLTYDEPSFIGSGYVYLKYGDFRLNPAAPPLMQELVALPLMFLDVRPPVYDAAMDVNPQGHKAFGRRLLFESGNDFRRIAFWARLPVLIFGTALILAVFFWGRMLFGDGPALAGTAVAAFSPNLLAHSELATTDLGCSALMFISVWAFWSGFQKGRMRDWALCGLVTGLALLSKYTALLLGPIYVILAAWLMAARHPAARPAPVVKALAIIGLVSFVVVGAGYNFTFDWHSYVWGLSQLYADSIPGYHWYLLGGVSDKPFWYYNIVGLATKEPESTLLLIAMASVAAIAVRGKGRELAFVLVPAAVVIAASFFDKTNLGLRRILPAFPFLFLFAGYAAFGAKGRLRQMSVIALVGWTAIQTIGVYPHHLSYFNTPAGGPENGPYLFDDSNVDWGQDLTYLAGWQKAHPDIPLKLSYHGTSVPGAYGVDAVEFHTPREIEDPGPGYYAVSAHMLVYYRKVHLLSGVDNDWLSKYRPVDRAGYSIYIYRFD